MSTPDGLELKAVNAKEGSMIKLTIINDMDESTCQVHVYSQSMKVASAIVQSLFGEQLGISECMAKACFPKDFEVLEGILGKIEEANQLKTHLAANIADSI